MRAPHPFHGRVVRVKDQNVRAPISPSVRAKSAENSASAAKDLKPVASVASAAAVHSKSAKAAALAAQAASTNRVARAPTVRNSIARAPKAQNPIVPNARNSIVAKVANASIARAKTASPSADLKTAGASAAVPSAAASSAAARAPIGRVSTNRVSTAPTAARAKRRVPGPSLARGPRERVLVRGVVILHVRRVASQQALAANSAAVKAASSAAIAPNALTARVVLPSRVRGPRERVLVRGVVIPHVKRAASQEALAVNSVLVKKASAENAPNASTVRAVHPSRVRGVVSLLAKAAASTAVNRVLADFAATDPAARRAAIAVEHL